MSVLARVKSLSLGDWASIATIIGTLSVSLTAILIWLQLRQQTELTKAANTHALVALASPFNLELIKDDKMAEYWVEGATNYNSYDAVKKYQYISLVTWWLILHENIYFQWKRGLLDDSIYRTWEADLRLFIRSQNLKNRWAELKPYYQPDFVRHIEELQGGS